MLRSIFIIFVMVLSGCAGEADHSHPVPVPAVQKGSTSTTAKGFTYIPADSFKGALEVDAAVEAYPKKDDPVVKVDLDYVLAMQDSRTAEDCSRANAEAKEAINTFFGPSYGPLSAQEIATWGPFLQKVFDDGDQIADLEKKHFKVPRPPVASTKVRPCVSAPASPSYPSGHSTNTHLLALVLTQLDPNRADLFQARADQIAHDRVLAGVHTPTDIEAGKRLGEKIFREMLRNPQFKDDLQKLANH